MMRYIAILPADLPGNKKRAPYRRKIYASYSSNVNAAVGLVLHFLKAENAPFKNNNL